MKISSRSLSVAAALGLALAPVAASAESKGAPAAPAQANGQANGNAHKKKPDPQPFKGNDFLGAILCIAPNTWNYTTHHCDAPVYDDDPSHDDGGEGDE